MLPAGYSIGKTKHRADEAKAKKSARVKQAGLSEADALFRFGKESSAKKAKLSHPKAAAVAKDSDE